MVLRFASVALLLGALPLAAQVPARAPTRATAPSSTTTPPTIKGIESRGGWFGFRYNIAQERMIVLEVAPDSPAGRAGLMKGDQILTIDGRQANPTMLSEKPPVAGENLVLTVRRDTETLTVKMVATTSPTLKPTRKAVTAMDTVAREARELRGEMALKATRAPDVYVTGDSLSDIKRTQLARVSGKPMLIVDGVLVSESLLDTMSVNARIDAVVAGEMYATLKRLTESVDSMGKVVNSPELYGKLERTYREFDAVSQAARAKAVSGAEFEELNPGLADYFGGVGEGVFVLRVSGATPAFAAGLRAGDIVQSVNGQYVPTIADLRDAINEASGTITLRVIRKGIPASVTLRKE